ncbi:MAG TPA: NGG1p interacting factor NIF3 [Syntrophomonadaceae bacterium]|nr:NGG1p interacting factor NIF3 [Syntrophomonadaceae bacterium]
MKLRAIYDLAVEMGKHYDVRGSQVQRVLEDKKKKYEKLPEEEKAAFDVESLGNPFSDSRILVGSGEEEINSLFVGIDIETPEILLADRLRERGQAIDLVLAHHPEGLAQAAMHEVMHLQADLLENAGVPINVAESIMASRISEVRRGLMPLNHQRAVDAARLLGLPFMCLHTPADNLVNYFLQDLLDSRACTTLADVMELLQTLPEYQRARELKAGPYLLMGNRSRRPGRILVKMTGGTSGPERAFEKMAQAGVGTYICMHLPDKQRQAARDHHVNVIIAGHMASDSLGMNLFLDHVEDRGVRIIPGSGLIRIRREKGLDLPPELNN